MHVKVYPEAVVKKENEVYQYLMEDCAPYRFPFIIENAEADDYKYKAYIVVTNVKKHMGADEGDYYFDANYFVLKGVMAFSSVKINADAAWKFSRRAFDISNDEKIIKNLK
jgi:hypothetical protein